MHCHEILGVAETASREQIEQAFSTRRSRLEAGMDVLGSGAYKWKLRELEQARTDCIAWSESSGSSRLRERTARLSGRRDVRLNAVCFGPCTWADTACASECMPGCCPSGESCFTVYCGNQFIPIVADVILIGYLALTFFVFLSEEVFGRAREKKEARKQEERRQRIQRIAQENHRLEEQAARCRAEQQVLLDRFEAEDARSQALSAYIDLFSALGIQGTDALSDNHSRTLRENLEALARSRRKEQELEKKMEANRKSMEAL